MTLGQKVKDFFGFAEEEEFEVPQRPSPSQPSPLRAGKPLIAVSSPTRSFPSAEIKVEEPRIYEDSLQIATHLRENKPVIINLKHLDNQSGKRLIDFVCGTAYAINGHMMKIGDNIFLFTPSSVLIESGEKSSLERGMNQEERETFFRRQSV